MNLEELVERIAHAAARNTISVLSDTNEYLSGRAMTVDVIDSYKFSQALYEIAAEIKEAKP